LETLDHLSKVVVGLLNGTRVKGYIEDFSSLETSFNLLPRDDPRGGQPTKIEMRLVKAVFFVLEFDGLPEDNLLPHPNPPASGRSIEVTFRDGEKIVGKTMGYSPSRFGFFLYPASLRDNNVRIFVVTKNTRQVRLL